MSGLLSVFFVISVRSENGMGGTEFRVQSSEFRTEAQRAQRFFNDLSGLLSVSFEIAVRSENGMGGTEFRVQSSEFRVQSSEFRVQSSEFRVSHGGTEFTEVFQRFVWSSLRVLCDLREIQNGMGCIKIFAQRHRGF